MVITIGQLITASFRDIGALKMNEAPQAGEINDAMLDLNMLLDSWSVETLMVLASIMESFTLIPNKVSYQIGIGGDFNTSKPSRIDNAFIQDALKNRYPVAITDKAIYDTYEDALISSARPEEIVYDPGPTQQSPQMGTIFVYPITDTSQVYTLYIGQQKPLTEFVNITDYVTMQSAYFMVLRYSLDEMLWSQYRDDGSPYPAKLKGMQSKAMGNLVAMNARPSTSIIEIGRKSRSGYDIYSGSYGGGYSGV